jgi:hypothetical protein
MPDDVDENVDDWFDTLVRDKESAEIPSEVDADDQALDNLLDSLRKAPSDGTTAPLSAYLPAGEQSQTAESVEQVPQNRPATEAMDPLLVPAGPNFISTTEPDAAAQKTAQAAAAEGLVTGWILGLGVTQVDARRYVAALIADGFETAEDIATLSVQQLHEEYSVKITDVGKFLEAANRLQRDPSTSIPETTSFSQLNTKIQEAREAVEQVKQPAFFQEASWLQEGSVDVGSAPITDQTTAELAASGGKLGESAASIVSNGSMQSSSFIGTLTNPVLSATMPTTMPTTGNTSLLSVQMSNIRYAGEGSPGGVLTSSEREHKSLVLQQRALQMRVIELEGMLKLAQNGEHSAASKLGGVTMQAAAATKQAATLQLQVRTVLGSVEKMEDEVRKAGEAQREAVREQAAAQLTQHAAEEQVQMLQQQLKQMETALAREVQQRAQAEKMKEEAERAALLSDLARKEVEGTLDVAGRALGELADELEVQRRRIIREELLLDDPARNFGARPRPRSHSNNGSNRRPSFGAAGGGGVSALGFRVARSTGKVAAVGTPAAASTEEEAAKVEEEVLSNTILFELNPFNTPSQILSTPIYPPKPPPMPIHLSTISIYPPTLWPLWCRNMKRKTRRSSCCSWLASSVRQ